MVISVINHLITGQRKKTLLFYGGKKKSKNFSIVYEKKKKTFLRYCVSSNFLYIYLFFYLCFVSLGRPPIQKPNNTINVSFSDVLSERLCVCVERSEKGKCWGGGDKRYGLFYLSLFPITSKIENKKLKKRRGGGGLEKEIQVFLSPSFIYRENKEKLGGSNV